MFVLAMAADLRMLGCSSLKDKRATLRPLVDGIRHRHQVSVAETDHHDLWQRAELGIAVVSNEATHAEESMDKIERFIWSRPDIEVISTSRHWLEVEK
jgi:uncharacterized protein YlxP (DUF503 family)